MSAQETTRDKVKIEIDEAGKMYVEINGKTADEVSVEREVPAGQLLDVIAITKTNPTCVWRWGKKWCSS